MNQVFEEMMVTEMNEEFMVLEIPYRACKIVMKLRSQQVGGGTEVRVFDAAGNDIVPQFIDGHFPATGPHVRRAMNMIDFKLEGFKKAPVPGHSF